MSRKRVLASLCVSLTSLASGLLAPDPCQPNSLESSGFNVSFPFHSGDISQDDDKIWSEDGVLNNDQMISYHISDISEICLLKDETLGSIGPYSSTILEGFLVPPETGDYRFISTNSDNATLQVEAGIDCLTGSFKDEVTSGDNILLKSSLEDEVTVYLDQNLVYHIRIVLEDVCSNGSPSISTVFPNGDVTSNMENLVRHGALSGDFSRDFSSFESVEELHLFNRADNSESMGTFSPEYCPLSSNSTVEGFRLDFFHYPWQDPSGKNISWLALGGYEEIGVHIGTSYGSELYWDEINSANYYPVTGVILGETVQVSNFMLEITGFFTPKETGNHTFLLDASKGISFQIGKGSDCCGSKFLDQIVSNTTFGTGSNEPFNVTTELTVNQSYPIRMLYYNSIGSTRMNVSVILPSGELMSLMNTAKMAK
mgnify:FL=1